MWYHSTYMVVMPTLRRIRLEVGNYEFSFSHILGFKDK